MAKTVAAGDVSTAGELWDFYSTMDLGTLHLDRDRVFLKLPTTGRLSPNGQYRSDPVALSIG